MKRKLLIALAFLLTFGGGMIATAAVKSVNGLYDGFAIVKLFSGGKELKPAGTPGILYKGTTLVPVGSLRDLGVDVIWDGAKQSVEVKLPTRTVPVLIQSQLDELAKAAYLVYGSTDDPNKVKQGSGFIVDGTLITNYHVGGESKEIAVQINGQWQKTSQTTFENESVDIMGIPVTGGIELPVSMELPQVGDPIYAIGFPHGKLTITEGEVYNIIEQGRTGQEIVHTAKVDNGASGSILVDGRGRVIGINESGYENFGFAIPINYVLDELN